MRDGRAWLVTAAAALLGLTACGSAKGPSDAGHEVKPETKADGGAGAPGMDAKDAPAELPPPDAPAETAPDAAPDVSLDATSDVAADAAVEVDPACQTIPEGATRTVHLRITADNECEVFVNGADVGNTTSWPSPVTIDVSLFVHPGRVNVIGVMARNTSSQGGPDRGIIGELDDLTDGGSKVVIVTDGSWKSSKIERSGWPALLYDDSGWEPATVVGDHGSAPWGALLGTSDAKWLWSAAVPASTADKPDAETAFFRRAFYFGTDGATITDKPACPPPLTAP